MVSDLIRDAPFGQIMRWITGNRVFLYEEEKPGFVYPADYCVTHHPNAEKDATSTPSDSNSLKDGMGGGPSDNIPNALEVKRTASGDCLADWYTPTDPENPQNWSLGKKFVTALIIDLYTFVVYTGSAIYVSSIPQIMEHFGVGHFKASLGLALYVLGYGTGPMLFSPMSEIPHFGRNIPYISTFFIYTIISIPTSVVDNFGGLMVLRFLQGFFGSPCLATGGASMGDMWDPLTVAIPLALWVSSAFVSPAVGPLLSGFAVPVKGWRWSLWEIVWMAGPIFVLFFFFVPETYTPTILRNRAQRLRKLTGNKGIKSATELARADMTFGKIFADAVVKPFEIFIKDPAILYINVYTGIIYGIYYAFFEVFPLVYPPMYGFNIGETGLVFLSIVVGCICGMVIYSYYIFVILFPDFKKNGWRPQEWRLRPSLWATFGPPIGLFIFAWTARPDFHWIATALGITLYATSVYVIFQCIFIYVPMSYPQYAASLFASNDLFRSGMAFGSTLWSRPMFIAIGVDRGVSLLGGLAVGGIQLVVRYHGKDHA
ncbi:putative caffeine resistance protein 5 [Patellaria atrata CBS 101060]|uniref:Caffeine resistance protein 5 n=1 Tax=Patellaria atrata CBS 101060 TaxID=1346257 RepID=A0A9P4VRI2_9PEZI|nr:putative caffeine resistance protein 5 [Patellaria atrata CBS 101060]